MAWEGRAGLQGNPCGQAWPLSLQRDPIGLAYPAAAAVAGPTSHHRQGLAGEVSSPEDESEAAVWTPAYTAGFGKDSKSLTQRATISSP